MKYFITLSILLGFISCSGSKSVSDDSADAGIELADAVEFTEESEDIIADTVPEALTDAEATMEEQPMVTQENTAVEIEPMAATTGEVGTYTVQENETLMMIAFNIYGDYSRWREIAKMNPNVLNGSTITKGMQLSYNVPAQPFVYNPTGNPYLVKEGDYLGKVSMNTYGTSKHWQAIWDNNKPLIKDPNVIFAGFTIYTPIIQGRDVAFDDI